LHEKPRRASIVRRTVWRRNGTIRRKEAFRIGVARRQRGFHCGSKGARAEKVRKCSFDCRQLEVVEFTQSWIVIVQSSRAPAVSGGELGRTARVKLKCKWAEFAADESGATAIEYGLIAAGIALAIIEIIYALGTNLVAKLQSLATALK
jgi:pilus assembly protein Flp/PilA